MAQPSSTAAPPPPPAQGSGPPPRKSRKLLWIGIGIVVVVVIVVIAALAYIGSTKVDVTAINFTSADNACGMAGNTMSGFTTSTGGTQSITLSITNSNILLSCTVTSVTANTSGFSISGANTPLTIPAGGSESLSFTVTAPGSSYTGVLTIDLE